MTVIIGEADSRLIGGVLGIVNTDTLDRGESGGTSVGVVGLAGESVATDDWNGNVESNGQPVTAAVLGVVPIVSQTGRPESTSLGFLGGDDPVNNQPTGVYGQGRTGVLGQSWEGNGVLGLSHHPANAAISAVNDAGGLGLWAESRGGTTSEAGHFRGSVEVEGDQSVSGKLTVQGQDLVAAIHQLKQDLVDAIQRSQMTNAGVPILAPTARPSLAFTATHGGPGPQTIFLTGQGFRGNVLTIQVLSRFRGSLTLPGPLPRELGAANGDQLTITATDGTPDDNDLTSTLWSNPLVVPVG